MLGSSFTANLVKHGVLLIGRSNAFIAICCHLLASSADKLYKIDHNQENRLAVGDVISTDREVYILDLSGTVAISDKVRTEV